MYCFQTLSIKDAVLTVEIIKQRRVVDGEYLTMCTATIVIYFTLLSTNLPGKTEELQEETQLRLWITQLKFETRISRVQIHKLPLL